MRLRRDEGWDVAHDMTLSKGSLYTDSITPTNVTYANTGRDIVFLAVASVHFL